MIRLTTPTWLPLLEKMLAIFLLVALLFSGDAHAETRQVYWHTKIKDTEFWVPNSYDLSNLPPKRVAEDILITTTFPDFDSDKGPVPARMNFAHNVRILFSDPKRHRSRSEFLQMQLKYYKATVNKGLEYGFTRLEQAKGHQGVRGDFWVGQDEGDGTEFIQCRIETPYPGCSHYFTANGFNFKVSYRRSQLPHCREIQEKSITLLESFKTRPMGNNITIKEH